MLSLIRSDGAHVGNDEVQWFSVESAAMVDARGCSERDLDTALLSCRQRIRQALHALGFGLLPFDIRRNEASGTSLWMFPTCNSWIFLSFLQTELKW